MRRPLPFAPSLFLGVALAGAAVVAALPSPAVVAAEPRTIGSIERLSPKLDELIAPDAKIEVLGEGYDWSEGPVWIRDGGFLLFSDVPKNTVYRWREGAGVTPYLTPSGYTGATPRGGEPGSNGLSLTPKGQLVLCQHGDRRVAILDAPLKADARPEAKFITVADRYDGKRFNSPNDLAVHSSGAVYFTDPPYGLVAGADPANGEIGFCGVYRVGTDGKVTLLTSFLTRPNGIAFSPDEKTLYVANSDPDKPYWMAYAVKPDGSIDDGRIFMSGGPLIRAGKQGLPDGFRVDASGNLIASGPGGVCIIDPQGRLLGTIVTGTAIANCCFGEDGHTLFITSDMYLCRVRMKTKGIGF